jgi:hypothetical protein
MSPLASALRNINSLLTFWLSFHVLLNVLLILILRIHSLPQEPRWLELLVPALLGLAALLMATLITVWQLRFLQHRSVRYQASVMLCLITVIALTIGSTEFYTGSE